MFDDAAGNVWLAYVEPGWLAKRHHLGHEVDPTIAAMSALLAALANAATGNSGDPQRSGS